MQVAKVFSATTAAQREAMGDAITKWITSTGVAIDKFAITQSSDETHHCLTVSCFGSLPAPGLAGFGFVIGERTYNAVEVFFATKAADREALGERLISWMTHRSLALSDVHVEVRQSSDAEFHCLTWVVFYQDRPW